jgi:hypothetical protein
MKKALVLTIIACFMLTGCLWWQITESSTHRAIAYAAGKGVGYSVNKMTPEMDEELSAAWRAFLERNSDVHLVPGVEVLKFYNEVLLIASKHTNDPLGLIGDLAALFMIFGGEYDDDGKLIMIKDVPMPVLVIFEMGYDNGRRVALDFN